MRKNFKTLKANVGLMIQDSSTDLASLIGIWINNRYRDVVNHYDWPQFIYNQTINVSASVSAYALDYGLGRITQILDVTNSLYIDLVGEQEFLQNHYDDLTTTGTPTCAFIRPDAVRAQPASAEKILAKSTSALDVSQDIFVRGILSTGMETYELLRLTGTTPATATNSYSRILLIAKSAATTGLISVVHNDNSTALAELSPETLESRYTQLHLHYIPSGAMTVRVMGKREPNDLIHDYDYPIINNSDNVVELGAIADALRYKRQYAKADNMEQQYQFAKNNLVYQEAAQNSILHKFQPTVLNRDDGIL